MFAILLILFFIDLILNFSLVCAFIFIFIFFLLILCLWILRFRFFKKVYRILLVIWFLKTKFKLIFLFVFNRWNLIILSLRFLKEVSTESRLGCKIKFCSLRCYWLKWSVGLIIQKWIWLFILLFTSQTRLILIIFLI